MTRLRPAPPRALLLLLPVLLLVLLVPALLGRSLRAEPEAPAKALAPLAIERLTRALEDEDRGVRYAAVVALGKAGADASLLAPRLDDPAWCVRREAGWWLRQGGAAGRVVLIHALDSASSEARATAAWALSACGAEAVGALVGALDDPRARREALASLRRIGPAAAAAVTRVRDELRSAEPSDRYEAALTLIVLAPEACEAAVPVVREHIEATGPTWQALGALLRAGDAGARVLEALGVDDERSEVHRRVEVLRRAPDFAHLGPRESGPAPARPTDTRVVRPPARRADLGLDPVLLDLPAESLAALLDEPERDVRMAATLALAGAPGDTTTPLVRALEDASPRVRRAAILGLAGRGEAASHVAPFLADPNPVLSEAARDALGRGGAAAARPAAAVVASGSYAALTWAPQVFDALGADGGAATDLLAGLLRHDDVNVRETAARCLAAIGPAATAAAPALVAALGDERLCVVAHAAQALGAIGLDEVLVRALDDPRARVRAYAAWAAGWALGRERGVDQVSFEVRLPVQDAGREVEKPTLAAVEDACAAKSRAESGAAEPSATKPDAAQLAASLDVLRRGLFSSDPEVALRAASALTYRDLDAAGCERTMEVLLPEGQREGSGVDFEELRSILGSSELPAFLLYVTRATHTSPSRESIYGHCHRMSRADTLPALAFFGRTAEPEALQGWRELWMPDARTDAHLRARAAFTLGFDPGADERAILHALLRHDLARNEGLLHVPELWLLNRHRPHEGDAALLLQVARSLEGAGNWHDRHGAYWAVLRALGRLSDADSEAYLREVASSMATREASSGNDLDQWARQLLATNEAAALAALTRRTDAAALAELVARSRTQAHALALLLEVAPREAVDVLATRLLDPAEAGPCLDVIADVGPDATEAGALWPEAAWLGLEARIAAAPPPTPVLGAIAVTVPLCRTRRLGRILLERWEHEGPATLWGPLPPSTQEEETDAPSEEAREEAAEEPPEEAWLVGNPDAVAAFLYSVDPVSVRALLLAWGREAVEPVRSWARSALLRVGDAAHGAELATWVEEDDGVVGDIPLSTSWLIRSDGPAVRRWLRERASTAPDEDERDEALETLSLLQGWVGPVPHIDFDPEDSSYAAWREAVLGNRMADARTVAESNAWPLEVDADPDRDIVFERLALRTLAGDKDARACLWSALRAGRYRWIQGIDHRWGLTLGLDPTTLPHWMLDLDSNCCRISDGLADGVFERPFLDQVPWGRPIPYDAHHWGVGRPPSEQMLTTFRLAGTSWIWSPLLDDEALRVDGRDRSAWIPAPE